MFLSAVFAPNMENGANQSGSEGCDQPYDLFGDGLIVNGVRSRKKITELQPCPVCSCTIRSNELQVHFTLEMDRLGKLSSAANSKRKNPTTNHCVPGSSTSTPLESEIDVTSSVGGDVYKKVRLNRLRRLRSSRRRSASLRGDGPSSSGDSEPRGSCPICKLHYPMRRLQRHALRCLRDSEGAVSPMSDVGDTSSDASTMILDVEGDGVEESRNVNTVTPAEEEPPQTDGEGDRYVAYEWCGQERLRATEMLSSEERRALTVVTPAHHEDLLGPLVVDGDEDEELYGPPQFSPTLLSHRDDSLLDDTWTEGGAALIALGQRQEPYPEPVDEPPPVPAVENFSQGSSAADRTLIQALRQRLRELEQSQTSHAKCHICLGPYSDPVVSIQCWHVHCETCWLETLRAKKTCPQCMAITTTQHLRRIYI